MWFEPTYGSYDMGSHYETKNCASVTHVLHLQNKLRYSMIVKVIIFYLFYDKRHQFKKKSISYQYFGQIAKKIFFPAIAYQLLVTLGEWRLYNGLMHSVIHYITCGAFCLGVSSLSLDLRVPFPGVTRGIAAP